MFHGSGCFQDISFHLSGNCFLLKKKFPSLFFLHRPHWYVQALALANASMTEALEEDEHLEPGFSAVLAEDLEEDEPLSLGSDLTFLSLVLVSESEFTVSVYFSTCTH